MFNTTLTDYTHIQVSSRKHQYDYATDGSKPNPLESTYASLAGCAGVYAIKAAKKLNKEVAGIKISSRPVTKPESPTVIGRWVTQVEFPEGWTHEEKDLVLSEVKKCAVKELLVMGHEIEFVTEEAVLA